MAQKRSNGSYLKLILCFLSGVSIAACGILFSAFLMVSRDLSHAFLTPLATLSVCMGCCGGAWLLARTRGRSGLLCGAFTGILFSAALFVWSWINGLHVMEREVLFRLLLIFLSGCIGGYLGMLSAEKHRRHR